MNKKTVLIIIALLAIAAITVGCTENYKQNPIGGNYDNKEIFSNGGMAVKYGDYLYFINGYAAKDDKNNFGDVVKGDYGVGLTAASLLNPLTFKGLFH